MAVGRVAEVDFRRDGVVAQLDIAQEWQIPSDLAANVHNRSAVGEQYVDLVPTRDGAPYPAHLTPPVLSVRSLPERRAMPRRRRTTARSATPW